MFCVKCGKVIDDNAKFCTGCGAENSPDAVNTETVAAPEKNTEAVAAVMPDETINEAVGEAKTAENVVSFSTDELDEHTFNNSPLKENSAVIDEPIPDAYPEVEALTEPEENKKLSAGRFAGAAVISVFLVIFILVFNLLLSTRLGLCENSLSKAMDRMNIEYLLDTKLDDKKTLNGYIYENLDGKFISASNAEEKDVRSLILALEIDKFAAENIKDYAAYLVDGSVRKDPSLTSDDVIEYLRDRSGIFESELDFIMSEIDYKQIERSLNNMKLDSKLSIERWSDNIGFNLSNSSFIFSFITIGIALAIVLVLYIWITIVLDKRGRFVMGYFGNSTFIAGLVTFIPALAFNIFSVYASLYTANTVIFVSAHLLAPLTTVAMIIGAFEIILGIIFKKSGKCLKKKALKTDGGI